MSWPLRRRDNPKRLAPDNRAHPSIQVLPVEVWKEIVLFAIAPDSFKNECVKLETCPRQPNRFGPCGLPGCLKCLRTGNGQHDPKKLLPVLSTCRFLYRVAISTVYSRLYYEHPLSSIQSPPNGRLLYNTLNNSLALRHHCEQMRLFVKPDGRSRAQWQNDTEAADMSTLVSQVKTLVFHADLSYVSIGERSNYIWEVLGKCTKEMSSLTNVSITRVRGTKIDVNTIMRALQIPSLQKLSLLGSCNEYEKTSRTPGELSRYIGTSELKELELVDFSLHPKVLEYLLSWPKELHKLRFVYREGGLFCGRRYGGQVTLPMLPSMLERHKETLTSLHIEHDNAKKSGLLPDLTDFTALEELAVFWRNLNPPTKKDKTWKFDTKGVVPILAPNLQRLVFSIPDTITASSDVFKDEDEQWLRSLAKLVQSRNHTMQEIRLGITPHIDLLNFSINKCAYPWKKIHAFRKQLQSEIKGLVVTCVEPPITEDDWNYFTENAHLLSVLRPFDDPHFF